MGIRRTTLLMIIFTSCALSLTHGARADVVVIANPQLPVAELSAKEVADIFLGKTETLAGAPVSVVDQKEGSAVKDEFYKTIVGKSPAQLKAYWAKIVFTGKGMPPETLADDEAVRAHVAATPGAIGYVGGAADGSVKVLSIKP